MLIAKSCKSLWKIIQALDFSCNLIESSHKTLRFVSKYLARQESNLKNAEDCFHRLWLISDPILRAELDDNSDNDENEIKDGDDPLVEGFFIPE